MQGNVVDHGHEAEHPCPDRAGGGARRPNVSRIGLRFDEYHGALFAENAQLDRASLDALAEQLELDPAAFASCLEEGQTKELVEKDLQAGSAAGVTGTPAFFINGIPLRGAVPAADFQRIIDQELEATS